ncbi:MAG: type transport system ATP-binding protein, partial [Chloroflexota bacterium]|nr:type transport system ATP-binding protein [Chloroflexota bacterium]
MAGRRWLTLALAVVSIAVAGGSAAVVAPTARAATSCDLAYLGLAGAPVTTTDGFSYVKWSGHLPSWDALPLDVDVSLPAGSACERPLIVFVHGFTDSKSRWESDSLDARPEDPNAWRWNNAWFVSRGYTVLTYTARGWHGSCGPDSSTDPGGSPLGLPADCTGGNPLVPTRQYWIHLSDLRYEVRDAQWLMGRLVDAGVADPAHIGVTGGSYGGGQTWLLAKANDRTVCGGMGWDAGNGTDPCAGHGDGDVVPWTSPGGTPMHISAAVPEYTWANLLQVLMPNGRASNEAPGAPPLGDLRNPVGVPLESYVDALFAAGYAPPATRNGFFQPPTSTDPTSNIPLWVAVLKTGLDTVSIQVPPEDAIAANALAQLADFKSPTTGVVPFDAPVPVYQLQGLTDPLFPAMHAELMWNQAKAYAPDYPIGVFYGDFGHPYATNLGSVPHAFNPLANAFFDHYLMGAPETTPLQANAAVVHCATSTADDPLSVYQAPSYATMADGALTFDSTAAGQTSNIPSGVEGLQTDPILNGTVGPGIFGLRCPHVAQTTDPGQATWTFPVDAGAVVTGAPIVTLQVHSTGPDAELNARLWDLGPDGMQTLMSRGTYRFAETPSTTATEVSYQLSPTAWELPAGHQVKLEVTGADWPYHQLDRIAAVTTVDAATLTLPTTSRAPVAVGAPAVPAAGEPGGLPVTATNGAPAPGLLAT